MFSVADTLLLVVDVQEKLVNVMHRREELVASLGRLIEGMRVLEVPIIATEQYPRGLGPTIPEIKTALGDVEPLPKTSFSCYGDSGFMRRFEALNRKQIVICGIETHVCVYQTVADLLNDGCDVQVVTDAVSSRTPENRQTGLDMIREMGAFLTSVETVLFELLRVAEGEKFKQISRIVK